MTLFGIEAFLAIVSNGTFTKAADALHITQSALSRRIRALEDELGYRVIARRKGGHGNTLTEDGKAFIPVAIDWMALWSKAKRIGNSVPKRTLRVAAADGPNIYVLIPVYKKFLKLHPDVNLDIRTEHSREAYADIEKGILDVAIAATMQHSDQAATKPAYKEKMLFACSKNSTYSSPVHPKNLNVEDYIYCSRHLEFNLWFENWFHRYKEPVIKCDLIPLIRAFLTDQNWTIIPASIATSMHNDPEIKFIPMEAAPPDRALHVVYIPSLGGSNPLVSDFLKIMDEHLRNDFDNTVVSLIEF